MNLMKAIQLKAFGVRHLVLAEVKKPEPLPHEVLVRIEAVSLNFRDRAFVEGKLDPGISLPRIPLTDGAGVVAEVGGEVTRWKKGDRVMVHFYQKWIAGQRTAAQAAFQVGLATQGVLSEFTCVPEEGLVKIPEHMTSAEASALPIAGLSAWTALFDLAGLKPGQTLVTQGSGGVSVFALQLAKAAGAKVIATSASNEKLDTLSKLGADETINYRQFPQWHEEVQRLTSREGADVTLDIGGASTILNSLQAVRRHGFVGLVGFLGGPVLSIDFFRTIQYNIRLQGFSVASRESFDNFARAAHTTLLRPVIDNIFPIEKTQEAFHFLEKGNYVGKIVIAVS
jgi:NADPH:quinone reductase-like Zn-dependent oxidoreductase